MAVVTASPKFEIVIPQDIREKIKLRSEQKLIVIEKDGVVHLIPEKTTKELRGFAKGVTLRRTKG